MYDSSSNALKQVFAESYLSGNGGWSYNSTDDHTVVQAPGYFSDAGKRGLKRGDIVFVRCTTTGEMTTHSVLYLAPADANRPLSPPGAASLSEIGAGALSYPLSTGANGDIVVADNPMVAYATLDFGPSTGNATVSGLTAGAVGQVLVVANDDPAFSVTLLANASATPANCFSTAIVIPAGGVQLLVYSGGLWTPLSPA